MKKHMILSGIFISLIFISHNSWALLPPISACMSSEDCCAGYTGYCCPTGEYGTTRTCPDGWHLNVSGICARSDSTGSDTTGNCSTYECTGRNLVAKRISGGGKHVFQGGTFSERRGQYKEDMPAQGRRPCGLSHESGGASDESLAHGREATDPRMGPWPMAGKGRGLR